MTRAIMNEFKLADSVLHRVVQIVQEAFLTGVDCADIMRQIRLQVDDNDSNSLVLTSEYKKQVTEMHLKLEERAKELQEEQLKSKLVMMGNNGDNNS